MAKHWYEVIKCERIKTARGIGVRKQVIFGFL